MQWDALASSSGQSTLTLIYVAEGLLNTSSYDYENGIKCTLHDKEENKFCSLSAVKIYAYVII